MLPAAEHWHHTGSSAASPVEIPFLFLSPTFVQSLAAELAINPVFGPILRCAAAALGRLIDRRGAPVADPAHTPKGGKFLVRCCLLNLRGQGTANRHCVPAGGRLRAQVLRDCHDNPLGGHFGRAKTGSLMLRLAFCVGH